MAGDCARAVPGTARPDMTQLGAATATASTPKACLRFWTMMYLTGSGFAYDSAFMAADATPSMEPEPLLLTRAGRFPQGRMRISARADDSLGGCFAIGRIWSRPHGMTSKYAAGSVASNQARADCPEWRLGNSGAHRFHRPRGLLAYRHPLVVELAAETAAEAAKMTG